MIVTLLKDSSVIGFGEKVGAGDSSETLGLRSFQVSVKAQSAVQVDAVVEIYGMNDSRFPLLVGTVTLTAGAGSASDAFSDNFPFDQYQAKIVSVSPSNAAVTVMARI